MVAERMRASLAQPIIIENVGGADGSIGAGRAAGVGGPDRICGPMLRSGFVTLFYVAIAMYTDQDSIETICLGSVGDRHAEELRRRVNNREGIMHRSLITRATQVAILAASILSAPAAGVAAGFLETDFVANKSPLTDGNGIVHTPEIVDPNLKNPWGVGASATSPFWVSDNNSGVSTLYNVTSTTFAVNPRVVSIPSPGNPLGGGAPTGLVFNIAPASVPPAFPIKGFTATGTATTLSALFLFATEDGTIVGWNPGVNPMGVTTGNDGIIAVDNSNNPIVGNGAVYKGLAIATDTTGKTLLYATNFRAGTVEVYDAAFNRVTSPGAFTDPNLPPGYAPFNIVLVGGRLVVTFAVQDGAKHDDVAGESHGIVDTFDLSGGSLRRLVSHCQLNSPWGVTLAPSSFGELAGLLLIGNFGNGHINAYDPRSGGFIDKVRDPDGQAIVIDGLWALRVGNAGNNGNPNTVYFSAGPNGEMDGLFGSLTPIGPLPRPPEPPTCFTP
jgi:uncharacterized protein (TIGR03118 family)